MPLPCPTRSASALHPRPTTRPARPAVAMAGAGTLALLLALLTACGGGKDSAPAAGSGAGGGAAGGAAGGGAQAAASSAAAASGAPKGPPVSVTLVTARQRDLPVLVELTGTVVPLRTVDVRPQVTAAITQVHVREGQFVRAGELLFTLDNRSDEANIARLRATLARDEAALADARRQLARSQELVAQGFISQGAADTNRTLVDTQAAVVAASKASLDAARITLGQARITAPAAGRVGAINLYPGSVVKANETTLLTITQLDPVDVAFSAAATLPGRGAGRPAGRRHQSGRPACLTAPARCRGKSAVH